MFYYPVVLRRHSGCFSTIWLMATKAIKPSRRELLTVNITSTCNHLMDYILEKVPPPQPSLPRPRFSLYLSSQLQYGLILVFHRQCDLLLKEVEGAISQLAKQKTKKLDLEDAGRKTLVLPDALELQQEAEGALEPMFGQMELQEMLPSLEALLKGAEEFLREAGSPAASAQDGITSSPDSITLKESPPAFIPPAEFEGVDFIEDELRTIDLLVEQPDYFLEEEPAQEPGPSTEEPGPSTEEPGPSTEEPGPSVQEPGPSVQEPGPSTEEPGPSTEEPGPSTQEPGPSVQEPGPPSDQLTPVSAPHIPSPPSAAEAGRGRLDSEEEVRSRRRRRRRRQLTFFDAETQLPEEEQQQQIRDPLVQTRPAVLVPGPDQRIRSAADLLGNPCSFLPPDIRLLWQQAAVVTPIPDSEPQVGERGPESSIESEVEKEAEDIGVPMEEKQPEELEISAPVLLPLEASDQQEASREISPVQTSEREGSIVSRSVSALQDIPEVMDEVGGAAESPRSFPEFPEHDMQPVFFSSLLPPNVDRKTVSSAFHRLLGTLSAGRIRAEQDEAYGDILILPGSQQNT